MIIGTWRIGVTEIFRLRLQRGKGRGNYLKWLGNDGDDHFRSPGVGAMHLYLDSLVMIGVAASLTMYM